MSPPPLPYDYPIAAHPNPTHQIAHISLRVTLASYALVAAALLLVMQRGLLPGLLCACLGFLITRWMAVGLGRCCDTLSGGRYTARTGQIVAATLAIVVPVLVLAFALSHSRTYLVSAPAQYRELLNFMARTVLELREKLPPDMAAQLPEGAADIQRSIASYLAAQAGMLATAGRVWLGGLLHAYVGLIIGTLAAIRPLGMQRGPLVHALVQRVTLLGEAFRQIVAAQFWIAAFNTALTALFLLLLLPLWSLELPYTPALITLTFVGGLIPIVGNLLCNAVITIVGLSVSPAAAASCLAFLIVIHKAEYIINAKVVGQRTHIGVWELLAVMFTAEAVFGPAGLVAAPLMYAYIKKELQLAHLV